MLIINLINLYKYIHSFSQPAATRSICKNLLGSLTPFKMRCIIFPSKHSSPTRMLMLTAYAYCHTGTLRNHLYEPVGGNQTSCTLYNVGTDPHRSEAL